MVTGKRCNEAASRAVEERMQTNVECGTPLVISRIMGVDFIQVPLSHYLDLARVAAEAEPANAETAPVSAAQLAARVGSPIYLDHEVADFLYAEAGRMTIDQARVACAERFGPDRTPSRSAVNRYWLRVRRGLEEAAGDRSS